MSTEIRQRFRSILWWAVVTLAVIALAITFLPALSELRSYRMAVMILALAGVLGLQALSPPQGSRTR